MCGGGVCQAGCFIGGAVYADGALNPSNACQSCNPTVLSSWYQVPSDCALIAAHERFTCAVAGGVAKCWGANDYGGLGAGQPYSQTPFRPTPSEVSNLGDGVQAVSAGVSYHACALVGGGVKCWGWNGNGQLGDGSTSDRNAPVQVSGLTSGVQGIATGYRHSCALLAGQVRCWGRQLHRPVGRAHDRYREHNPCRCGGERQRSSDRAWFGPFLRHRQWDRVLLGLQCEWPARRRLYVEQSKPCSARQSRHEGSGHRCCGRPHLRPIERQRSVLGAQHLRAVGRQHNDEQIDACPDSESVGRSVFDVRLRPHMCRCERWRVLLGPQLQWPARGQLHE
jgi:hypothetical protein